MKLSQLFNFSKKSNENESNTSDLNLRPKDYMYFGKDILTNEEYIRTRYLTVKEHDKKPLRTEIINFLLEQVSQEKTYLEIGVRNPDDNFNLINAQKKYSVDPGVEFEENPVDFKMTSDVFFENLYNNTVLNKDIKFDVIFIDGLHLADQVDRDIINALNFIKDDGFIVLHDCNPPTEWHARENYNYKHTPADGYWNGTTWKAFLKWRTNPNVNSCCIDTDWGIGILSKNKKIGQSIKNENPFFEYKVLENNRKYYMNLIEFNELKNLLTK